MNSKKGSQTIEFIIMAMLILVICFTGLTVFGDNIKAFFEGNTTKTASLSSGDKGFSDPINNNYEPEKELNRLLDEISEIASGSEINASSSLINIAQALLDYFEYLKSIGAYNQEYDSYLDMLRSILGIELSDGDVIPNDVLAKLLELTNQFDEADPNSLLNKLLESVASLPDNHPEKVFVKAMTMLGANISVDIDSVVDMIKTETEIKATEAAQAAQNALNNLISSNKDFLEGLGIDTSTATVDEIITALNTQESSLSGTSLEQLLALKSSLMNQNDALILALQLANVNNLNLLTPSELLQAYLDLVGNQTNEDINGRIIINTDTPPDELVPPDDLINLKFKDDLPPGDPNEPGYCGTGYYYNTLTETCRPTSSSSNTSTNSGGGGGHVIPYDYNEYDSHSMGNYI